MLFHSGIRPFAYLLCALVPGILLSGCAGQKAARFTADTLPTNYRYQPQKNPRQASLASLASFPRFANSIGPGDHLEVDIAAGLDRDQILAPLNVIVSDNGTVWLPELGQVNVQGMKVDTAGTAIQRAFIEKQIYKNPLVTVRVEEKQTNKVRVLGGVAKPGVYELPTDQSDVLTALTMAGSLSESAGDKIQIRTPGVGQNTSEYAQSGADGIRQAGYSQPAGLTSFAMQPVTISIGALAAGGMHEDPDRYKLQDGAVVMVQELDPIPISVRGLVEKPGPLEPTANPVTVMSALTAAGGISNQFANKILVIRQTKQGNPITISLKLTEAKVDQRSNLFLAPGDIVSVEQTPGTLTLDALRIIRFGVSSRLNQLF